MKTAFGPFFVVWHLYGFGGGPPCRCGQPASLILAALAKSAGPTGHSDKAVATEKQPLWADFTGTAPGWGLSGSADLASEASMRPTVQAPTRCGDNR